MSSVPGNVFDESVPLRPGHLPGISSIDHSKVHYRLNTGRRDTSNEQGWTVVQNRRARRGKEYNGWKGSSDKKNVILL